MSENLSTIQDKTRAVLETNVQARAAQSAADKASAAVDTALKNIASERSALDGQLGAVGDLSRLGPALAGRTRDAVGQDGSWIAEGAGGPQTLAIPKSQLNAFLGTLFSGLSSDQAASNIASLSARYSQGPVRAGAGAVPGSAVIPVGQESRRLLPRLPDRVLLAGRPGDLEPGDPRQHRQDLGPKRRRSLIGYRFESPPSAGNAPYGDQGVTVQVESLDSDHAVNYLDVTFHKFLQDIPDANGVVGQAEQARMMVFDDFALLVDDNKEYFGAIGFGDLAATDAANQPYYYGGNLKASVKFTQVLSLNASQTALFATDPRKFLQSVNLDFTGYDPSLNQNYTISGSGDNMNYERSQVGVGIDLAKALKEKNSFVLDVYYAHTSGNEDPTQSSIGATILKGFAFNVLGQNANLNLSAGGELGQVQDDANARISFEFAQAGDARSHGAGQADGDRGGLLRRDPQEARRPLERRDRLRRSQYIQAQQPSPRSRSRPLIRSPSCGARSPARPRRT